jgi:hypothetical protein
VTCIKDAGRAMSILFEYIIVGTVELNSALYNVLESGSRYTTYIEPNAGNGRRSLIGRWTREDVELNKATIGMVRIGCTQKCRGSINRMQGWLLSPFVAGLQDMYGMLEERFYQVRDVTIPVHSSPVQLSECSESPKGQER